jgi:hypothetical protein
MSVEEQLPHTSVEQDSTSASRRSPKSNGGHTARRIAIIVIVVAIVTAAVVYALRADVLTRFSTYLDAQKQVATVNGAVVRQGELTELLEQIAPGQAATLDETIRSQVLDDLVNVKLLLGEAKEKGYTVTDDAVQEEFDALVEQFGGKEAFEAQLAAANISERDIREDIADELLLQQLVESETDIDIIAVTDEDVQQAYDEAVELAQSSGVEGEIPPLDDVREVIAAQLEQQKQQEIIEAYVNELREGADIEITL